MSDTAPENQDQPQVQEDAPITESEAPEATQEVAQDQSTTVEDSFTESYDPDSMPDEVRPAYEAAYKRLQADYTKKRQAESTTVQEAQQAMNIVQALQDPERAPEILEILGYNVDLEDDDDEGDGSSDDVAARVDALTQQLAAEREQAQEQQVQEAITNHVSQQIEDLESEANRQFTDDELDVLFALAADYPDANGYPDATAAYAVLDALVASRHKEMIAPKATAPRSLSQGQTASREVDLSTSEARLAAAEKAAARAMTS